MIKKERNNEIMKQSKVLDLFFGATITLCLTSLIGCAVNNNSEDYSDIDGGPNSRIVGLYEFDSSSDYLNFYETFKEYNTERFLCPMGFHNNSLNYYFRTEGINYNDFHSNRYDIDFDLINMFFEFELNDIKIKFETFDLSNTDISFNNFSISYDFAKSNKKIQVNYYINDISFAKTQWLSDDIVNNSVFANKLDSLTLFLEEGVNYVL